MDDRLEGLKALPLLELPVADDDEAPTAWLEGGHGSDLGRGLPKRPGVDEDARGLPVGVSLERVRPVLVGEELRSPEQAEPKEAGVLHGSSVALGQDDAALAQAEESAFSMAFSWIDVPS